MSPRSRRRRRRKRGEMTSFVIQFSMFVAPKMPRKILCDFTEIVEMFVSRNSIKVVLGGVLVFLPRNMVHFHVFGAEDAINLGT